MFRDKVDYAEYFWEGSSSLGQLLFKSMKSKHILNFYSAFFTNTTFEIPFEYLLSQLNLAFNDGNTTNLK